MYLSSFNFLGIGTQQGQRQLGLVDSAEIALRLMPNHWPMAEKRILTDYGEAQVIHRTEDFSQLSWAIYLKARQQIRKNLRQGQLQLNWGGDHSVGLSSVAAFTSFYSNGYVLWIDAHADLNTPESSPTGNFHGMPLSILLGIGEEPTEMELPFWKVLDPRRLIYFGLRDLDPYEKYLIQKLGITAYSCEDLNNADFMNCVNAIKLKIAHRPHHISFDIDSVDPVIAPSTGVSSCNGLNPIQLELLAQQFGTQNNIKSMDVVEINPSIGSTSDVQNTYNVAFNFLDQLFNFTRGSIYDANHSTIKNELQVPF